MPDDSLCAYCSSIQLYSLFTGARYYSGAHASSKVFAELGTVQHVRTNTSCPLCRLVNHLAGDLGERLCAICDPSHIRCSLWPLRMDYADEMHFSDPKTQAMLATRLQLRFTGLPHISTKVREEIGKYRSHNGIQLLSPDSVDPARPLQNGFQATTTERSLQLLKGWIDGCQTHHGDTCRPEDSRYPATTHALPRLRVIDVCRRQVVEMDTEATSFAALSYVWGAQGTEHARSASKLDIRRDGTVHLPESVPKVIDDAMRVCSALSVPYLWADLYCVDQVDSVRKAAEIHAMGHIYRNAYVTLVAGGSGKELLSSSDLTGRPAAQQMIETIDGRVYITEATRLYSRIFNSEWSRRSWTYQEGHLSRRIAYFDAAGHDVSFLCGAGHWRESLHSGVHGHDITIPGIDLSSSGFHVLAGHTWLRSSKWNFDEYRIMGLNYTRRRLSYESDKLAALAGCLRLLGERKGVTFVQGLPTTDFHYALLWTGEDGPRRAGFPSWSWAGWNPVINLGHLVGPASEISARLEPDSEGNLFYRQPAEEDEDLTIELSGTMLRGGMEAPHLRNRCTQRLATLQVSSSFAAVTIQSEAARFFVEAIPQDGGCDDELCRALEVGSIDGLDKDQEYMNPWECLYLRDKSGNRYRNTISWHTNWPIFHAFMPDKLRGDQIMWLMRDGVEVVKMVDIEFVEGDESFQPFRYVLCLGIDRSEGLPGRAQRMGVFCIPGEYWEKAGPEPLIVELW